MEHLNKKKILLGEALPATLYVLIYTLYTVVFSFQINLMLIRISYMVFYVITLWFTISTFQNYSSSPFIRRLTMMFGLILLYGAILHITGTAGFKRSVSPFGVMFLYISSILPIYPFYYFERKGMINPSWFKYVFFLFCVCAYGLYFHTQQHVIESLLKNEGEFTNNSGYVIVSLLPFIAFFEKRNIIQYVILVIIILATILCFKRGAIVVAVLSMVYFFLQKTKSSNNKKKLMVVVLGIAAALVVYWYVDNLFQSNAYFYSRVIVSSEGDSSGRDQIYSYFLNYYFSNENGIIGMFFGNGMAGTVKIRGIEAHNDWIEILIDMGLLGVFFYLSYWITNYKYYRYARKHLPYTIVMAMGMVLIINFSRTLFSMSLNDMSFFSASLIGYTMALVDKNKTNKILPQK